MKRTRVRQFVRRLTGWHSLHEDIRNQPWIVFTREMSIEDAKRIFGFQPPEDAIGCKIGYTVYGPMEVTVSPQAHASAPTAPALALELAAPSDGCE